MFHMFKFNSNVCCKVSNHLMRLKEFRGGGHFDLKNFCIQTLILNVNYVIVTPNPTPCHIFYDTFMFLPTPLPLKLKVQTPPP